MDAHRTIAFVVSPFVRRETVDATLYSAASMLRTMELILGLRPMPPPRHAAFARKESLPDDD